MVTAGGGGLLPATLQLFIRSDKLHLYVKLTGKGGLYANSNGKREKDR